MNTSQLACLTPSAIDSRVQQPGNTRMEAISVVINHVPRTIHLKLESDNPTGSIKDRTAYGLMQTLEQQDRLHKNSCIIESTSGNLGVALASLCKARGYDFVAVVDPKATQENIERIRALGAEVALVTQPDQFGGYLLSRLDYVRERCRHSARYIWPNQYENNANPRVHRLHTGPEIYRQMHGQVDAIFAAVSTGGTLAGIGQYFRAVSPATRIVAVDAYGSVVFGTTPGPRKLTGIGASQPSRFIKRELYDEHMLVTDQEAFAFCRALFAALDISVGGSSGAVLAACTRYLADHPELTDVVCLCPDGGKNYAASIFDNLWLQEQHLFLTKHHLGPVQSIERPFVHVW